MNNHQRGTSNNNGLPRCSQSGDLSPTLEFHHQLNSIQLAVSDKVMYLAIQVLIGCFLSMMQEVFLIGFADHSFPQLPEG
jgi:hypothetical protein